MFKMRNLVSNIMNEHGSIRAGVRPERVVNRNIVQHMIIIKIHYCQAPVPLAKGDSN